MVKRKTLTVDMVKKQIQVIKDVAKTGDYEHAYSAEIELYQEVLKAIASDELMNDLQMIDLAKEALKASKIKFTRVTA